VHFIPNDKRVVPLARVNCQWSGSQKVNKCNLFYRFDSIWFHFEGLSYIRAGVVQLSPNKIKSNLNTKHIWWNNL